MRKKKEERDITWIVSVSALVLLAGSLILFTLAAHEYKVHKIFRQSAYLVNEVR